MEMELIGMTFYLRNATIQDHNITLSSRNDKMGVTAVAGLFNQQGGYAEY